MVRRRGRARDYIVDQQELFEAVAGLAGTVLPQVMANSTKASQASELSHLSDEEAMCHSDYQRSLPFPLKHHQTKGKARRVIDVLMQNLNPAS